MASTIKVNNIQNQCGANIANKCGSTVTLGASGDTITLACGASQTGFGRTGTVDWDTTPKTANFTAANGTGYFVNTTSGAITVTLPASPSAGDIVAVSDYAQTAGTNNITMGRNGSNIEGDASDLVIENNGVAMTFVYADATKGWKVVSAGAETDKAPVPVYIEATGGTVTCCGDYKIHTFTSPGTFCVSQISNTAVNNEVSYIVVAGGGGGGKGGGGGGAGGFRESKSGVDCYSASPLEGATNITVTATAFPITVGSGGAGQTATTLCTGSSGNNSVFSTVTSAGGGGGGSHDSVAGLTGGSGGGNGNGTAASGQPAKAGNTPPVSPPQGQPGGASANPNGAPAAGGTGGGGAGAAGGGSSSCSGGDGGNGVATSITGSSVTRAGGGGGSVFSTDNQGSGGSGGGGAGGPGNTPGTGTAGTTNTGGGGGGGGDGSSGNGGNGGSGIVIIRYKYQ